MKELGTIYLSEQAKQRLDQVIESRGLSSFTMVTTKVVKDKGVIEVYDDSFKIVEEIPWGDVFAPGWRENMNKPKWWHLVWR